MVENDKKWSKMTENGLKMTEIGRKIAKNGGNWPKSD
jgi:hypothetical protein